jgi:polynucleotide 5'-hydroxyl-kinase GRC3/NOL9
MMALGVPEDWRAVAERILDAPGVVVVLGGTDSGKSTFCAYLGKRAAERDLKAALVDADVGQSQVGPPGCIGWAWIGQEGMGREQDLWFVGDFSPVRYLAECVVGTFRLVMSALARGAQLVIVDTTGLVRGREGLQLKMAKLQCLRPRHVIAFRRDLAATAIMPLVTMSSDWQTHIVEVPPEVRIRSREERRAYRLGLLQSYLAEATEEEFGPEILVTQAEKVLWLAAKGSMAVDTPHGGEVLQGDQAAGREIRPFPTPWERRLCSLEEEYGRCLGVGITTEVDPWRSRIRVRWRRHREGKVRLIRVSDVPLDLLGME